MSELSPQSGMESRGKENTSRADGYMASADLTVSDRFRKLIPEKARKVKKLATKTRVLMASVSIVLTEITGIFFPLPVYAPGEPHGLTQLQAPIETQLSSASAAAVLQPDFNMTESSSIPKKIPKKATPQLSTISEKIDEDQSKQKRIQETATPIPPVVKETSQAPLEKSADQELLIKDLGGGIKVAMDKDGIPIYYSSTDGRRVNFNRNKMEVLRQISINNGEPELIDIINVSYASDDYFKYSKEHPMTSELPKDVLSKEELAKKGIEIIQADSTSLYIRKGAFEKGGPFEDLADLENVTASKLTIILVNGPVVDKLFTDQIKDPHAKAFMESLNTNLRELIPSIRSSLIQREENELRRLNKESESLSNLKDNLSEAEKGLLGLTIQQAIQKIKLREQAYRTLTDKEIGSTDAAIEQSLSVDRMRAPKPGWFQYNPGKSVIDPVDRKFIAIAVGANHSAFRIALGFDKKGRLLYTGIEPGIGLGLAPSQTYPEPPGQLGDAKSPVNDYLLDHYTSGVLLRHEAGHYKLKAFQGGSASERDADLLATKGIKEAWEKWEKSGHTDNSGYYFVFSLPKEKGGGYILTKAQDKSTKTSEKA